MSTNPQQNDIKKDKELFFGKPFAGDPEIAALERETQNAHNDYIAMIDHSVKEILLLMQDIGLDGVLNNETFNWLLQEHFNEHFGKYPFEEKMPYADTKSDSGNRHMNGPFSELHKVALIQFFNLLETGDLNKPIVSKDFYPLLDGKCGKYRDLDRKASMLEIGAIDEFGNTNTQALHRVQKTYSRLKDGNMFNDKNIDNISTLTKDTMKREDIKTFPQDFQKYTKLADLYDKAHCGHNDEYLRFFNKGREGIRPLRAKQIIKKYEFLLGLSKEKSHVWILENISEQEFFDILEVTMHISSPSSLEELNTLLQPISWFPDTVGGTAPPMDYKKELSHIPFLVDFEERLADPQGIKNMFYKEILPNSIQSQQAMVHLGLSKEEKEYMFNLSYTKNQAGFDHMQKEYAETQQKLQDLKTRTTPLLKGMQLTKRITELGFIVAYLSGIDDPGKYQQQLQLAYTGTFLSQRFQQIDFTRIGNLYYLYGAIHRKPMPKVAYIPHYSLDYYPEFILPVLKILQSNFEG